MEKPIKDSEIIGATIHIGVYFDQGSDKSYKDLVNELLNKFACVVEKEGHECTIGASDPVKAFKGV